MNEKNPIRGVFAGRVIRRVGLAVLVLLTLGVAVPVGFLGWVWWNDARVPTARAAAGFDDASRMNATQPEAVIPIDPNPETATRQVAALVENASREKRAIAISGARHSMGGHALFPGGLVLDMLPLNHLAFDEGRRILRAGAGARWTEVLPFLDARGFSVGVMQSNNDFTVGGSLSVNCHGWQSNSPPIASTVESFRLATAGGKIVRCSRTENAELFSLALGGYGLFGVILDAELRVVPNEFYRAATRAVPVADFARAYEEMTQHDAGLAYGRVCVAPIGFLEKAIIVAFQREATDRAIQDTLKPFRESQLKRIAFRGSVGSDFGKNLRWVLERWFGDRGSSVLSRNEILNQPSEWFSNRDPAMAEILHEYFVPVGRFAEFIGGAREVLRRHRPDLLNVTVRKVKADPDTFLRYAREDVFGLVMLFDHPRTEKGDGRMADLTRELIDVALRCGGTYYLPYRPHATADQFLAAYPMAPRFFALKKRYDPQLVFRNRFFEKYGR